MLADWSVTPAKLGAAFTRRASAAAAARMIFFMVNLRFFDRTGHSVRRGDGYAKASVIEGLALALNYPDTNCCTERSASISAYFQTNCRGVPRQLFPESPRPSLPVQFSRGLCPNPCAGGR